MFLTSLRDVGHFSYFSRVFSKMDLKIKKNDFLHMVYFQNPEIEHNQPLSKKI